MRRILITVVAFFIGSAMIAGVYFGILIWAQEVDVVQSIFLRNRWYVIPRTPTLWISAPVWRMAMSLPLSEAVRQQAGACWLWVG